MSEVPDYVETYHDFWADLVETDGQLDFDKVARELHDYRTAISQVGLAYDSLTGGRLSKPNSDAGYVIDFATRWFDSTHGDNLRDFLRAHVDSTADELRVALRKYADELDPDGAR